MSTTLAQAFKVLEHRTDDDPALAEAVVFMAEGVDGPEDPFAPVSEGVLRAARVVNERRLRERRAAADAACLDTAQVVGVVRSISDRKGVDRRRHRGQLLGWRAGAGTFHPSWQFDRRRGDTRRGLPAVLAALSQVSSDPEAADVLMRAPREDLGGTTLAEQFASGRVETVLRLIRASADQS